MKIKKILILPDVHLDNNLPLPYKIVRKFIQDNYFDMIVLLGDFMDIASLSDWDKDKRLKLEGRRYVKEVELANKELDFLSKFTKKIIYLEGNHEYRVRRYIEIHPEVEGLIELPRQLNLKERKINWIAYNELYKIGKLYLTHGMYSTMYSSKKHLTVIGANIVFGHTHKASSDMMNMKLQKPIMAWGLGCLCDKSPDYMKGRPSNWINGFGMLYLGVNGEFNLYPVNIINKKFIWNNKLYTLTN